MKYNPITREFLENHKELHQITKFKFQKVYTVYNFKTKIKFVLNKNEKSANCLIYQSDDRSFSFNSEIFLGIVRTKKELNDLINYITKNK